ncbi:MAG TPA: thioredoxin TrxC [Steroidobacteraceae bacterium]
MSTPRQLVCQSCDSLVRVPAERLGDGPRCPKCHAALFDGQPLTLTAANFDRHVALNDLPLVVDFWAPWCAPCRAMAPVFEQAAGRNEPAARFARLNTEDAGAVAARHGIRSIPTLVVFKGGQEVARQTGAMDARALDLWLATALA